MKKSRWYFKDGSVVLCSWPENFGDTGLDDMDLIRYYMRGSGSLTFQWPPGHLTSFKQKDLIKIELLP